MEQKTVSVNLVVPTDEEAIAFIEQLIASSNIPASQATNILCMRAWLGALPERLPQVDKAA